MNHRIFIVLIASIALCDAGQLLMQTSAQPVQKKVAASSKIQKKVTAQASIPTAEDAMGLRAATEFEEEQFKVNVEEKRIEIVRLVKKGIEYLIKKRPAEAFHAFINNKEFTKGDVSLFVIDTDANVYVPEERFLKPWKNLKNYHNAHGIAVADLVIAKANKGGGWIEYEQQDDYKSSYVEKVEKDGISYVIGAGWYPASKKLEVESVVKSAVNYFYKFGKAQAFREFDNKVGRFVRGDLYIYVYDMRGYCVAHGDNTALIGRDLLNLKDDNGFKLVQALIEAAKNNTGWVSYQWKNAPKVGYVERVSDASGEYVIGSGYYPEASRNTVVSLVKHAVKYFYAWGQEKAAAQFNRKVGEFVYGDLALFMYDFEGNVLSQGDNPDLADQNIIDLRSADGGFIVKDLIEVAKQGSGWLNYRWKNDLIVSYVEKVTDAHGSYLIGAGFYPDTAHDRVEELVRSGIGYLKTHTLSSSMRAFSAKHGGFVKGAFNLFVMNMDGDCLVYGDETQLIWSNFKKFRDVEGKEIIPLMMQKAQRGGGWIEYKSRGASKFSFVQRIEKDNVPYIMGSSFYK